MKKKEIIKRFPFTEKPGICYTCAYIETCNKILPGFHKPKKCGGPFYGDKE